MKYSQDSFAKYRWHFFTRDGGDWLQYNGLFHYGYKRDDDVEICWSTNSFGRGRTAMAFSAMGIPDKYSMRLSYGFAEGEANPFGILNLCYIY